MSVKILEMNIAVEEKILETIIVLCDRMQEIAQQEEGFEGLTWIGTAVIDLYRGLNQPTEQVMEKIEAVIGERLANALNGVIPIYKIAD